MESSYKGIPLGSLPAYEYQPLDLTTPSIRLFKIDASQHDGEAISGSLITVARSGDGSSSQHAYRALSYEWGSAKQLYPIVIDNQVLWIRATLHDFLMHYRRAISLNQVDTTERNHQVKLMHDIYSQAQEVVVWLPHCQLDVVLRQHNAFMNEQRYSLTQIEGGYALTIAGENMMLDQCSQLFEHLSGAGYWKRLWVQQEVFLAQEIIFAAGDVFMECRKLRRYWSEMFHNRECLLLPENLTSIKHHLGFASTPWKLLELGTAVAKNYEKVCEDPKDKFFGLMAMVTPEHAIAIDYSMTPGQVFDAALAKLLETEWSAHDTYEFEYVWAHLARSMSVYEHREYNALRDFIVEIRQQYQHREGVLPIEITSANSYNNKEALVQAVKIDPMRLHIRHPLKHLWLEDCGE